ncbi:MAG: FAD-binding oxidoreductase [Candidatus Eisenbacteria bacterium]|nr:FAD-binding oxidoreductase [Candidatus Eisenbacteria bacterium]
MAVSNLDFTALRERDGARLLLPGEAGYDEARAMWNGMIERRPAAILQCTNASDVAAGIDFARDRGVLLAVKAGGHSAACLSVCDGGLTLDLSPMRSVRVDAEQRRASTGGGALLRDLDAATSSHRLAVPAGVISHTGIGGLTLGGGFGWISRKYGLTIDHLLSAEVVTADGEVRTASEGENADLFWAIRGGGGNFGVVTRFDFRCDPHGPDVFAGLIVKRFEDAKPYFAFQRDFLASAPDDLTVWNVVRKAPPLPFLPSKAHGKLIVVVAFAWAGDPAEGKDAIDPLRNATPSLGEAIGTQPWTAWQSGLDPLAEHGARNYWKSHHLTGTPDGFVDAILEGAKSLPSDECEILIAQMGGAPSRVPVEATAYAHRDVPYLMNIHTRWRDPAQDAECLAWVRGLHEATAPFSAGVYVNLPSDTGEESVKQAYPPATLERLAKIKAKYDPTNLFRMNQNIAPRT